MTTAQRATQVLKAMALPVVSLPHAFNVWLAEVNTTSLRIFVTIAVVLGTAIRYWMATAERHWEPSLEWLGFLATMSGLDAAQFFAKRKTHKQFADDPPPTERAG